MPTRPDLVAVTVQRAPLATRRPTIRPNRTERLPPRPAAIWRGQARRGVQATTMRAPVDAVTPKRLMRRPRLPSLR